MSACCRNRSPRAASSSRTRCRRAISSRDRKRVSAGRRFLRMPRVGLVSMQPLATAKLSICRNSLRALLALPGAVRLNSSNQRLTCAGVMRSSGFDPNAGSRRPVSAYPALRCVDGLYRSK